MKSNKFYIVSVLVAFFFLWNVDASAQGFLKKISKGIDKVTKVVDKGTDVIEKGTDIVDEVAGNAKDDPKSVKWDAIPTYTPQVVYVLDEEGNNVLNEDGTKQYHVFLVDQNGNIRSKEAVKAQNMEIIGRVTAIIAKLTTTTAVGAKEKGVGGALLGAGLSVITSIGDIKMIKKQLKSLKEQKKMIESYSQNFTDEGVPVSADVDLSKVVGLDFNEENALSMRTSEIKKELESESFNTVDDAWDLDSDSETTPEAQAGESQTAA